MQGGQPIDVAETIAWLASPASSGVNGNTIRGSIVGTLIGALIVGVFRNGLALAGLDVLWQEFTVGVLIITAVTLDQWIRRVSA